MSDAKHNFFIMPHCIACTTCSTVSPSVFKVNDTGTTAIIINQPRNPVDTKKTMNALKSCPVAAIGVKHND